MIRKTEKNDVPKIFELYRRVASVPGGLARLDGEISEEYVSSFVGKALVDGLSLVAEDTYGNVIGELHAYTSGLFCFSHVLTDLTVAVDPDFRNQGIAKKLFERFFIEIDNTMPNVCRVELISRESNHIAISLYESLGFVREGRLENRIKNVDGSLEADIPMGWQKCAP